MNWAHSGIFVWLFIFASSCFAEDWPQWRGVRRDGTWRATGITQSFEISPPKLVWRKPIGAGYTGPTVSDGRVFVADRITEPEERERVHCFDLETGEQIWVHVYTTKYGKIGYQAGPRAAVTIDGDRAYSLGATGRLVCLGVANGDVLWGRDLDTEYKISQSDDGDRMPIWGIAASPLLVDDKLILHIGGRDGACVVAVDKLTGQERWRALDDRAQYSAPILIEQAGRPVVVVWTGDSVAGLALETGEVYWRHEMTPINMPIGIATPIVNGDLLYVTSFYDGSLMLRLNQDKPAVTEVWRARGRSEQETAALHSIISTPIWIGDYIYGVDSYGELRCLEAATGKRIWEDLTATPKARWSTIHFTKHDSDVWMFNERGEMLITELSPQGLKEKSRAKLINPTLEQLRRRDGVCWSHPAFAEGHVIARNDNVLVCYDLRED